MVGWGGVGGGVSVSHPKLVKNTKFLVILLRKLEAIFGRQKYYIS